MASISSASNGTRMLQFTGPDGGRRTIRLGKVSKRDAETIKSFIERIIQQRIAGVPLDAPTADWIRRIEDQLHDRIARSGLIDPRDRSTLGTFIDRLIEEAAIKSKPSTLAVYGRARRLLVAFFGEDRRIDSITEKCASEYRAFLAGEAGLSENTVRRMSGMARQFFGAAVEAGMISRDPFRNLTSKVGSSDESRKVFVTTETIQRVIDACPDAEWRLLVGLARYGGLRVPSEPLALKWKHVNWSAGRITVPSPKTEHHRGMDRRIIPIFPELEPLLREAFDAAPEGAENVIHQHRLCGGNYATRLRKIIDKAGVDRWPKLWHNLRASRETELLAAFPAHVACRWIGNSPAVALEHYALVQDEDFDRATGWTPAAVASGTDGPIRVTPAAPPAPAEKLSTSDPADSVSPTAATAGAPVRIVESPDEAEAAGAARCKMRCSQRRTGGDTRTTEPPSRTKKPLSGPPEGVRKGVSWAMGDSNRGQSTTDPVGTYANRPDGALQNALQSVLRLDQHELLAVRGVIDAMLARTDATATADT